MNLEIQEGPKLKTRRIKNGRVSEQARRISDIKPSLHVGTGVALRHDASCSTDKPGANLLAFMTEQGQFTHQASPNLEADRL